MSVHSFPKDETVKEKWIKAISSTNLRVSKDTVFRALHWPFAPALEMARCTIQSRTDIITTNMTRHKSLFNQAHAAMKKINYLSASR